MGGEQDNATSLRSEDSRFRQFVRYGSFKATIDEDGEFQLYDMLHPKSGIGEQMEVSAEKPDLAAKIQSHLKSKKITDRYVTIEQGLLGE